MRRVSSVLPACVGLLVLAACGVRAPVPGPDAAGAGGSRLARLLAGRVLPVEAREYEIGPGDRVHLTVTKVEALTGDFDVTSDGLVLLPLLGAVPAVGHTERGLAAEIAQRLATDYLQAPDVTVSVTTFRGRRVSVVGAVRSPGFYPLRGGRESILDLVMRAGGPAGEAGAKIFFSPRDGEQLEIDLTELYQDRNVPALEVPVRDGDTIFVQEGGEVFVEGWVRRPSPYPLERAMTLTQAISKAGGLHFAASLHEVVVSRRGEQGALRRFQLDYARLVDGTERDLYLAAGDRVRVAGAPAKVAAWGLYRFVSGIVNVGIGGSIRLF